MSDQTTSRRTFLAATGSVAAAGAVAGCTEDSGGSTATETTDSGSGDSTPTSTSSGGDSSGSNTLNRIAGTITTFDPIAATDTESGRVIQQMFDTLMNYKNATTVTSSLLAADYQVSDDFTTYTIELKDATFHNGDPVTASDLVYSFER
ncbi:MAG: ABC transporter substrate-binding protein, partial [Halobaculum sp.]